MLKLIVIKRLSFCMLILTKQIL